MIASLAAAWAGEAGIQLAAGPWREEQERAALVGLGAWGALPLAPRAHLEVRALGGPLLDGGNLALGAAGVRGFVTPPEGPTVSLALAGGALWEGEVRPSAVGSLAVDPGRSPGDRVRLEALYAWAPGDQGRVIFTVGSVFGREGPDRVVVEQGDPPPSFDEGMVWLPDPVCRWLPPGEASVEALRAGLRLSAWSIVSERTLGLADARAGSAEARPVPGRLLVAASDADRVWMDGAELPVTDGLATAIRAEGRADVRVVGGGRVLELPVGIVDGHAVWVGVEPPSPERILFASGSAALTPAARARLAEIAAAAGGWSFEIVGSASPEGNPAANAALGRRRAEAVRDALVAAGVPPERLIALPPAPPAPGLTAPEQRYAALVPVEAP